MTEKLNEKALGFSGAIVSALAMLVLGIIGPMGIYGGAMRMMQDSHMFFSPGGLGIITGIIEAGIIGFIFAYALAIVYNRFA